MKKILVTGGAGFIGSNLCKELLKTDSKIYCLDNLYSGSLSNIEPLIKHKNFSFIEQDILEPIELDDIDEIYNLACPASPGKYQQSPVYTTKISVLGAINVLELAKKCNSKILQASTSEIYGDPLEHPQKEDYFGNVNVVGPRSCYDEGKRCAETLFYDYYREYKVKIKIVRIFNTYGPNFAIDDGRVMSNFIVQALQNKDITIYGDGSQTRSFCYVSDMISGFIKMMNSGDEIIGPINLGNPHEITMLDLAKMIINVTDSESKIVFKSLPVDDPTRRMPSIEKAKEILEWEPMIDIDEGLKLIINYFKKVLQ